MQWFADMGFDRHYRNMPAVTPRDVVMPSIGGAGSSLLGNVVLELGLPYVDLNRDVLALDEMLLPRTAGRRFMKTHLPAEEFAPEAVGPVWLLVRDPRDAVHSWYRYHRNFGRLEWERVPATFEEFLRRPFFAGRRPVDDWWAFYEGWQRHDHHVIRYEDLRTEPVDTMRAALAAVGFDVPDLLLRRAVAASSYAVMRRREDAIAGESGARVMRRGQVGEWREWMTPRLQPHFWSEPLAEVAARFGYDLTPARAC